MPSTWRIGRLEELATISTSSFSPLKQPELMLEHYSIPAFDASRFPIFELAKNLKSNKYVLNSNSVLASKLNPETKRVWRPLCLSEFSVCSTEFIVYEPNCPEHRDFIYSIIDSAEFSSWMCSHTTGSTNSRQRTTPSTTLAFRIPIADSASIATFCDLVTPMYNIMAQNLYENQRLASLRDGFLPRLISGEIDVSAISL